MRQSQSKVLIILLTVVILLMASTMAILLLKDEKETTTESSKEPIQNEGTLFEKNDEPTYDKFELGLEMVRIPEQTFTMGNYDGNPEGTEDELPYHDVRVNTYFISKYEITQKQYEKVMGTSPSFFKGENMPVTNIDWNDAIKFCNALSTKEGLTPCYEIDFDAEGKIVNVRWNKSANGYRLPTEAEHECAAQFEFRGQPLDATRFGWFFSNGDRKIHNVGQKEPNVYSLYDIIGNVWEWCWDIYGPFENSVQENPTGQQFGEKRVSKGGSYTTENSLVRASDRGNGKPTLKGKDLGVRLVRNSL